MTIGKGEVVTMSYLLSNAAGEELDRSDPNEPLVYLHGVGQIVPGLKRQLEGLKAGDQRDRLIVPAAEAFGWVRNDLQLCVSRAQFPEGQRHAFKIMAVSGDKGAIQGNHPLVGETLHFSLVIDRARDATKEELEHGHAHGPEGHSH